MAFQVLISRNYRGDIDMSVIDNFMTLLMEKEEEGFLNPILTYGTVNFLYTKYSNIYIVATTKKNSNAVLVFQFLHKMVQVRLIHLPYNQTEDW